jgi:hypothetical protein
MPNPQNPAMKDVQRRAAFLFGVITTLGWMALFRYCSRLFWTSPIVPWSLIAGTLGLTVIRQRMLHESQEAARERSA